MRFVRKTGLKPPRTVLGMLAFIFVSFILSTSLFALSSVNVPLDHWSYDALDKLRGFGLITSDIYNNRPYSRLEVARLVNEAMQNAKDKKLPSLIERFFEKFRHEFKSELEETSPGAVSTRTFIKPVQQAEAKFAYVQGDPRQFDSSLHRQQGLLGIKANSGTPLLPNNEGVVYTEHSNFSLQFASSARFLDYFSAYVEPIFIVRENKDDFGRYDQVEADLLKGYGKATFGNFEFQAGRDSMWWGQGYHGTLILGNNAPPLDMIKISNPTPTILPWYFRYLGLTKYTIFVARLENDRDLPHAMLGGVHTTIKPHPLFELGMTYNFMFNGQGAQQVSLIDVLTLFRFGNSREKVNSLASLDARVRLPFLKNAELYAEYGGEDTTGPRWYEFLWRDVAYVLGIYFPSITDDGKTDLRVEYSNNAFKQGDAHVGSWYSHAIYTSGYTYDGLILGHQMGPDATDLFIRTTHYVTDKFRLGLDYTNTENGITLGKAIQRINSGGIDLTYDINKWLSITGRYAYGDVSNFNNLRGDDRTDHLFLTALKVYF